MVGMDSDAEFGPSALGEVDLKVEPNFAILQLESALEAQEQKLQQLQREEGPTIEEGRKAQARVDAQKKAVADLNRALDFLASNLDRWMSVR